MMNRLNVGLLAGATLLLAGSPGYAGGSTMHLAQASFALEHIDDAVLRGKLELHLDAYLNGANFPDTFNFPPASFYYTSDDAHSGWFLTKYAERVKGSSDDELLAHFMGTLAHIAGDWRFDRYMLTGTTRECFPDMLAGQSPSFCQDWTDKDFDWLLAPLRLSPASGILTPSAAFVPYEVGYLYGPFADPSILEAAFPGNSTIPSPTLNLAVGIGWTYVENEHLLAGTADPACGHAVANWDTALGGAHDGGKAIAAAINTTWAILQSNGTPVFEQYGPPGNPYVEFYVSDSDGGSLDCAEFSAWIEGPQDALNFEVEGDRIMVLTQPAGIGTAEELWVLDGNVDGTWGLALQSSEGVTKFQLEEQRTAVLLGNGDLLLQGSTGGPWDLLAERVDDFELAGDRITALVRPAGDFLELAGTALGSSPRTRLPRGLHIKDLALGAAWRRLLTDVVQYEIEGSRVATLTRKLVAGQEIERLRVTENALVPAPQWTTIWSDSHTPGAGDDISIALAGDRIGMLSNGTLSIMDGTPGGMGVVFQIVKTNVQEFQLAGADVGALGEDQILSVLSGASSGSWVEIDAGVASFQLVGSNPDWTTSAPWLTYSILDGTLRTNRSFALPQKPGFPTSHAQRMPVFGAVASEFKLAHSQPYAHLNEQIKPMDRLAVLVEGQLYFQELPPVAPAPTPPISMTPYAGVAATWVQMNWDWVGAGPNDYVAIYDEDPLVAGPNGYLLGQWQWATQGPTWASTTHWKAGYYMAYIHEDQNGYRHIVDVTEPTQVYLSSVTAERDDNLLNDWVELHWETRVEAPAGHRDFVALYDHDPLGGDPDAYLLGEWQWATNASPWTSGAKWAAGYYVGYVQEDALGDRVVLSSWGPTEVTNVSVDATKYAGLTSNWIQLNWSVTDPGTWDFVALYDHDPLVGDPNAYLTGQWKWATNASPWVSNQVWAPGYYVGYVQQDIFGGRTVVATSEATACSAPPAPTVSIVFYDGWPFDWIQLNWSVANPGPRDYVALYNHPPTTANGYMAGQWQWATGASSWVSGTIWTAGHYIAYIHEDDCGNKTIIATAAQ